MCLYQYGILTLQIWDKSITVHSVGYPEDGIYKDLSQIPVSREDLVEELGGENSLALSAQLIQFKQSGRINKHRAAMGAPDFKRAN